MRVIACLCSLTVMIVVTDDSFLYDCGEWNLQGVSQGNQTASVDFGRASRQFTRSNLFVSQTKGFVQVGPKNKCEYHCFNFFGLSKVQSC